jgi:hypothetical protein
MKLITTKINSNLKKLIKEKYKSIEKIILEENKRINHVNIYHNKWSCKDNETCTDIINILKKNYSINTNNLISMGFITAQINCYDQHFHIDYNGTTETYFIPLVDLTDKNGTEYLEFIDSQDNLILFDTLIEITDKFNNRSQLENYLDSINISKNNYKIKILNGNKWCMVHMPNYLFHRGQSNKSDKNRTMFQIILAVRPNSQVSENVKINDSELDEENGIITKLIESRSKNEK